MLAGACRSGKTDFIHSFYEKLNVHQLHKLHEHPLLFPLDVLIPTESSSRIECDDSYGSQHIFLTFIDTPGAA
jgi:septin family protein